MINIQFTRQKCLPFPLVVVDAVRSALQHSQSLQLSLTLFVVTSFGGWLDKQHCHRSSVMYHIARHLLQFRTNAAYVMGRRIVLVLDYHKNACCASIIARYRVVCSMVLLQYLKHYFQVIVDYFCLLIFGINIHLFHICRYPLPWRQ